MSYYSLTFTVWRSGQTYLISSPHARHLPPTTPKLNACSLALEAPGFADFCGAYKVRAVGWHTGMSGGSSALARSDFVASAHGFRRACSRSERLTVTVEFGACVNLLDKSYRLRDDELTR